jgi:hypothetical protein
MAQGSSTLQRLKNQIKVRSSVHYHFVSCAPTMKCFVLETEEGMTVGSEHLRVTDRIFLE